MMSDNVQWALKAPAGYLLRTHWRRTDALQDSFETWGGEKHQGPRHKWWRHMKRNGWSVVKVRLTEVEKE